MAVYVGNESDKVDMPDGLGHAVGLERWELLAKLAGREDPFEMNAQRLRETSTTPNNPTIIPSMYEKRLVGCVCEEDSTEINWMYVTKGITQKCSCGYYFKLIQIGMHPDSNATPQS